jgi:hypothetical protein
VNGRGNWSRMRLANIQHVTGGKVTRWPPDGTRSPRKAVDNPPISRRAAGQTGVSAWMARPARGLRPPRTQSCPQPVDGAIPGPALPVHRQTRPVHPGIAHDCARPSTRSTALLR